MIRARAEQDDRKKEGLRDRNKRGKDKEEKRAINE